MESNNNEKEKENLKENKKQKQKEKKNKKNKITDKKICEKCQNNKSKVYNRNKFLCLDCFNEIIIHKFKSNLRTHCKIKQEDYILVCISGGNFSMGMLEMFRQSFDDSKSNRKLFFKIKILYIDDSLLLKNKEKIIEERNKRKLFLKQIMEAYKFDYDIINLEKVMDLNNKDINLTNDEKYEEVLIDKYLNILDSIPNAGGFKSNFIKITINNLIFFYSIKNNFTKIVFGNNGQGLVRQTFFSIITGNGKDVKHNITITDNSYLNGKVVIYRPLQDFFDKEIMYFNHYYKVQIIYPIYKDDNLTGILSSFFGKLQSEKLNTVPSVVNTAEKVVQYKNEKICKFCLACLDKNKNMLEFGLDNVLNDDNCILNKELCYGCRRIFIDVIQNYLIDEKKEKSNLDINEILNMFKCLI
jgi:tRNA(Ile)-lysidine synthase TilS/MesJ